MAFLYPWGNTQQLNLDWILQKIKDLEAGSGGGVDLDEVANALISASYAVQAYDRSDIVFRDGKLYQANQAIPAPGEAWTPAHWDEILLGDTVSNLVQYVAALSNDQIVNSSSVSGDHTSDALDTLKNAIDAISLDSDSVSNESQVTGDTVSDALDNLDGAIDTVQEQITEYKQTTLTANRAYHIGEYFVYNGDLYLVKRAIANGATITIGTNAIKTTLGNTINTGSIPYTPDFIWSPNDVSTPPTISDIQFSYAMINANLIFIYGRFKLVTKNITNTSNSLAISIPAEWLADTSRPAPFGLVFGDTIENFVIRPIADTHNIYFAYGGGGAYSMSHLTEGKLYAMFCIMPVKLT